MLKRIVLHMDDRGRYDSEEHPSIARFMSTLADIGDSITRMLGYALEKAVVCFFAAWERVGVRFAETRLVGTAYRMAGGEPPRPKTRKRKRRQKSKPS